MSPAAAKIDFDVEVDPDSTQWYGTLRIKNLRQNGHDKVTIQRFLGVVFKSPKVTAAIQVNPENLHEWGRYKGQDMFTESIEAGEIYVMAKLNFAGPYTLEAVEGFSWGINGDLTGDPERWKKSFEVYADCLPSGTIGVECAAAPESHLTGVQQVLRLQTESSAIVLRVPPGKTTLCKVPAIKYRVVPDELVNPLETVVAEANAWPNQLVVPEDETVSTTVTYGQVVHYLAVDVKVNRIQAVSTEEFYIKVTDATGKTLGDTFSTSGHTAKLRRLPWSAKVDVSIGVVVNNVRYIATKKEVVPQDDFVDVSIAEADIQEEQVPGPTVHLNVEVKGGSGLDRAMAVHLLKTTAHAENTVYKGSVRTKPGSTSFPLVAPGTYTVQVVGFVNKWVVYAVFTDPTLEVKPDGTSKLSLRLRAGANLKVRGFPGFLSFGGITDLVDRTGQDFINARAASLFKYAGIDGGGDPDKHLPDDPATTITIEVAQNVQKNLGEPVLPIMISYTCNLSGGNTINQLQDESAHEHSLSNLILSLQLTKQHGKPPVPAGYVINPDFLGECQANDLCAGHVMPVKEPLKKALKYRGLSDDIPETIDDSLGGYVLAVNWLVRTVAPEVTFGWQVNLWGGGEGSAWMYGEQSPAVPAKQTADYVNRLNVFNAHYQPDFLAVDRYEADDFTERGYGKEYCYGPYEWRRFFDFCAALSLDLKVPVVPWQIPASRIPLVTDDVDDLEKEHWGTGGSYILGDADVGSEIANINRKILDIEFSPLPSVTTVRDLFKRGEPFDLTQPAYMDLPLRGIPGVLLGGGQTTGIVDTIGMTGPWTQKKLKEYRPHALSLENSIDDPKANGPKNDVGTEE